MKKHFFNALMCLGLLTVGLGADQVQAQADSVNTIAVGIMSDQAGSTTSLMSEELSETLDGWSGIEVRTMLGRGVRSNIDDILYLKGVDMGFVNTDVLTNLRISEPDHPALSNLAYLFKVADSELHLVASADSGISSIEDLNGKTVSVGALGSGAALTSRLVMRLLGIEVTGVFLDPKEALADVSSGTIDAAFLLSPKPYPLLETVLPEDNLKLVSIPYDERFVGTYNETSILAEDYSNIVEDKFVSTISVPVVLAAYNRFARGSSRLVNLETFSDAFLQALPRLQQPPRHPKWREVDLNAELPGWQRFEYLENALAQ